MRGRKQFAVWLTALFLPWYLLIGGAVSAGVIGTAAWNLSEESKAEKERAEAQAAEEAEFRAKYGDPATWEVPPLVVVEPWNPDDANAPS